MVQHFPGVGVELNCLFPIELVIFKVSPGHLLPPTSSPGPCMTDPDRVSCLNHELSLVCIALIFLYCKNNLFDRQNAYVSLEM